MSKIISFCIFDDLQPCFSPICIEYNINDSDELSLAIDKIVEPFLNGKKTDPSGYYFSLDYDKNEVLSELLDKNYYVLNRYQKYYVIAFAINYTRFEIYSKDCNKKLIRWRDDDKKDKVEGIIVDENYNENPVITFMKSLSPPGEKQ